MSTNNFYSVDAEEQQVYDDSLLVICLNTIKKAQPYDEIDIVFEKLGISKEKYLTLVEQSKDNDNLSFIEDFVKNCIAGDDINTPLYI